MIIDLRDIFSAKVKSMPVNASVDISDYDTNGIVPVKSGISVCGTIKSSADVVSLQYEAEFTYSAPCDRCAVPTKKNYALSFAHTIVNELFNEQDESSEDFLIAENLKIDLDEIVRTDVILNLPFKFLCKEDCKGVCEGCGVNLNEQQCKCIKEADPRFSKLDDFFKD